MKQVWVDAETYYRIKAINKYTTLNMSKIITDSIQLYYTTILDKPELNRIEKQLKKGKK